VDDRLRALERAARSAPGDREAAWAFVRALEQAGDARAAWSERCRLMRAGDAQAWREVSPARRGAVSLEVGAARSFPRGVGEVCGDGRTVFVSDDTTVQALDARSLETSWSVEARGPEPGALWGPYLVHVAPQGSTLVVRARDDGAEVASIALPPRSDIGKVLATPGQLVAVWDRQDDDRPDELFVIDIADGAIAESRVRHWPEASGLTLPIAARDVVLQPSPRGSTIAYDLASSRVRWSHEGVPAQADAHDAILHVREGRSILELSCVDLSLGRLRWSRRVEGAAGAFELGPDLVIVAEMLSQARAARANLEVDALDRSTGELRWSLRDLVGSHVVADVAAADGVVYVAYGASWVADDHTRGFDDLTILCVDSRTGERVGAPCRVIGPAERPILRATLVPVDGGVLVTVRSHHGTWLGRVGER
jgi:outer membrane protein assembly factor BamB